MSDDSLKKPDEGRLIDYLLNESSPQERIEIENLCQRHSEWNEMKEGLVRTLGLLDEACKQPLEETAGDMSLDPARIKILEDLVRGSGEDEKAGGKSVPKDESAESKLFSKPIFWGPLAAAACAAFLAGYPSFFDEPESEVVAGTQLRDNEKTPDSKVGYSPSSLKKQENIVLMKANSHDTVAKDSPFGGAAQPETRKGKTKQTESLQSVDDQLINLSTDGANSILAKRTKEEVVALNKSIDEDASQISLADAFSLPPAVEPSPTSGSSPAMIGRSALAAPPAPSDAIHQTSPAPPLPVGEELERKAASLANLDKRAFSFSDGKENADNQKLQEIDAATESNLRAESVSSPILPQEVEGIIPSAGALQSLDEIVELESTLPATRRSKPDSWKALFRQPGRCLLFSEEGEALGWVESSQAIGTTCDLRRVGDVRQGKRFTLPSGQFQLRYAGPSGSVVILSGELKKKRTDKGFEGTYEFSAEKAWWLDGNEVRQPLPIEELSR
jgi:hypothetical protein